MSAAIPLLAALGLGLILLGNKKDKKMTMAGYLELLNTANTPTQKQAIIELMNSNGFTKSAQALTLYYNGTGSMEGVRLAMLQEMTGDSGGSKTMAEVLSELSTANTAAEKQAIIEDLHKQGYVQSAQAITQYVNGLVTLDKVKAALLSEFKA